MITTFIFDLGGVVLYQNVKRDQGQMGRFVAELFGISYELASTLYNQDRSRLIKGEITSEIFLKKLKNELVSTISIKILLKKWRNMYINEVLGVNHKLIERIKKLNNKYTIALFTNTIDTHAAYFDSLNISKYFNRVMKSFEVGFKKPDKEAYEFMLSEMNVPANEIIFIDDLEENVKAAEDVGMKGIVFKDNTKLKHGLLQIGIKL